jgi:hypothetical protein
MKIAINYVSKTMRISRRHFGNDQRLEKLAKPLDEYGHNSITPGIPIRLLTVIRCNAPVQLLAIFSALGGADLFQPPQK